MPPEKLGGLRCPKCGNDLSEGGKIRYVETIDCYRTILRVERGQLVIEGLYETGEGYDDGTDPRFQCHGHVDGRWCGHEWSVPDWIGPLIDWV